jgi:hypothetical protein
MKPQKKDKEIVLINVEGPRLKAKKAGPDEYVLYDYEDGIVDILNHAGFVDFVFNKVPVTYTDGKDIIYSNIDPKTKANRGELARFMFGEGVNTHFIEFDKIDGQWLSPVPSERENQIEALNKIFPSYSEGLTRWEYLNSLIKIALEHKELMEKLGKDGKE